jgi:hypothetical protein
MNALDDQEESNLRSHDQTRLMIRHRHRSAHRLPLTENTVAKHLSLIVLLMTLNVVTVPASADTIAEWGAKAVAMGAEKQLPTSRSTRVLAMTNVAMFEAVNAIDRRYKPYKLDLVGDKLASRDAAAAAAAHGVLIGLFPDERAKLDQALQKSLSTIDSEARTKGIELGMKAAAGIGALRSDDGSNEQESYRPYTQAGVYVPTALPAEITSGNMKPWVMEMGSQFRPEAPPALSSEVWDRDVGEIRKLGSLRSEKRTQQQTEIGRFWFLTGPRTFAPLARQAADAKNLDIVDRARLHALVAMAACDALIAVFDAKYAYNFWRPVTAIRNADLTANGAASRDTSWTPMGATPMHPEYPCAHCIVAAAVAEVLQDLTGGDVGELTLSSAQAPGVVRRWKRFEDYSNEVSEARIYAGFHYRFSTDVGKVMGKKIGELTMKTQLLSNAASDVAKQ